MSTEPRVPIAEAALFIALGDVWGHTGHGVDSQHVIASAMLTLIMALLFLSLVFGD